MSILVVAAHPDDEILGCGGTMARLAADGLDVFIAILGEGITSRHGQRNQADPVQLRHLQECSRRVANLVGAKDLFSFSLPDNRFDTVPLLDIAKIIEDIIGRVKPQVIYTQHGGDLNVDHVATFRATLTAARPMAGTTVRSVLAYEVASSTDWAFQKFSPIFCPNVFVDIGQSLETKIEAMKVYENETRSFPHPRSPEALRAAARRWGSVAGVQAAEAFELAWEIR